MNNSKRFIIYHHHTIHVIHIKEHMRLI